MNNTNPTNTCEQLVTPIVFYQQIFNFSVQFNIKFNNGLLVTNTLAQFDNHSHPGDRQFFNNFQYHSFTFNSDQMFIQKVQQHSHLSKVFGNVKKSLYNQQMLQQNIRNCQYFDCLFTHYVVMSDFYLYIIQTQQIKN